MILAPNDQQLLHCEWLLTNGLGGFACGTLGGALTRSFHAHLIAPLPLTSVRSILLNYVEDVCLIEGEEFHLSQIWIQDQNLKPSYLEEFRLEFGLPIWKYRIKDHILEKRMHFVYRQNTMHITYTILAGDDPVSIRFRPFIHFRTIHDSVNPNVQEYKVKSENNLIEIESLKICSYHKLPFTLDAAKIQNVYFEIEAKRGYACIGSFSSPGYFLKELKKDESVTFIASSEDWKNIFALSPNDAWEAEKQRKKKLLKTAKAPNEMAETLVMAADQFLVTPKMRLEDMVRMEAIGEQVFSVIAGYPWFADWGRDTMISLEGLTLVTGRIKMADSILRTFSCYIKQGLIPNLFEEGEKQALYNTADATLWFFHAVDKYLEYTNDHDLLEYLLPKLKSIIDWHLQGTLFGIRVDSDGLLTQGAPGYALTWMDAKVGDWVVTPRRGKAVEINALWYNALKIYEHWTGLKLPITEKTYASFNQRFWNEKEGYLNDIVDGESGDDSSLRPNQIFAISLKYPILEKSKWKQVVERVQKDLLTPYGLKTLSPFHPDYKEYYDGNLVKRDSAYHQGTVWPWLLGPFIDAWIKVFATDLNTPKIFISEILKSLQSYGVGTISEIFDAKDPYKARGCFAQAWSVAEILRCIYKVNQ